MVSQLPGLEPAGARPYLPQQSNKWRLEGALEMEKYQDWADSYFSGLHVIKQAIVERMESAGARLGSGSLAHKTVAPGAPTPPRALWIVVTPFNGPRQETCFEPGEVMRSASSIDACAAEKVDRLVKNFRSFLEDRDGYLKGVDQRSRSIQRWRAERCPKS